MILHFNTYIRHLQLIVERRLIGDLPHLCRVLSLVLMLLQLVLLQVVVHLRVDLGVLECAFCALPSIYLLN